MAKINILSTHVSDLIAAGEVVERPASVVKELAENAVDAGASQLTIEIKNGGMSYIRITDNGCGMSADDAKTCFLRHATSKLRDARDLEAIGTLGFRGEALAAISAVSKIDLITREHGAAEGTHISANGGRVSDPAPVGCPDGTTFTVRDLFYNTPARLKFIKNDRSEGSAVTAAVIRAALSHPEISVKYIKDGKEELHTPGDGRLNSCVYTVFGRDFANGLLPVSHNQNGITVHGFITPPRAVRGNRNRQYFFVNGRFIRSKTMQAALERAYENALFTGKFPACVLYIEISHGAVDVNVHPTKTEVKFSDEGAVFSAVYGACKAALDTEKNIKPEQDIDISNIPTVRSMRPTPSDIAPAAGSNGRAAQTGGNNMRRSGVGAAINSPDKIIRPLPRGGFASVTYAPIKNDYPKSKSGYPEPRVLPLSDSIPRIGDYQTKIAMPAAVTAPISDSDGTPIKSDGGVRIIGEALSTYIVVECGDEIVFIDKHAAHERVIFDKLRSQKGESMEQIALTPVLCDISAEDASLIAENRGRLLSLGFDIDLIGEKTVAVRSLPADIDTGDVAPLIDEICANLSVGDEGKMQRMSDDILHTAACKAAIKAGKMSSPGELPALVDAVMRDEVRYCPHGRPVCVTVTKKDLDKLFRRT